MKNLPTDVLRSFVTVAEFGSFTQASELLSRSQPAVSLQLKRLETIINARLFKRHEQQLTLTPEGEILLDYAKGMLRINDEAISRLTGPALSGFIRFGIPSEFATTLLPRIVRRFSQSYPTVALDVTCDLSIHLLSPKRKKQFDLILALQDNPGIKNNDLIRTDELVWVTNDSHRAHQQEPLPLIAAPEGCIYRNRATQILDKHKRAWRIVYTIPDLAGIQSAIEEGLGVTVLARSTVPSTLKIIRQSDKYPHLGKIGIHLINQGDKQNEAVIRLMEFVNISLNQKNI